MNNIYINENILKCVFNILKNSYATFIMLHRKQSTQVYEFFYPLSWEKKQPVYTLYILIAGQVLHNVYSMHISESQAKCYCIACENRRQATKPPIVQKNAIEHYIILCF